MKTYYGIIADNLGGNGIRCEYVNAKCVTQARYMLADLCEIGESLLYVEVEE